MNKHIVGLIVFSFVAAASIFIYAKFNKPRVAEVAAPAQIETYSSKTSCWNMEPNAPQTNVASPLVKQAVFDLKTKEFNWELAVPEKGGQIALHFFVNDKNGTRYIITEQVASSAARDGKLKFTNSYAWLKNRSSFENLYVIAEFSAKPEVFDQDFQPPFDANKATAVTIDNGR